VITVSQRVILNGPDIWVWWRCYRRGVLLVQLQVLLLVGVESPAYLHRISLVVTSPTHLGVLMTLLIWIATTLLTQKILYLPEDLPRVLYFLSQLDVRPSLVTGQPRAPCCVCTILKQCYFTLIIVH
jgi:hypothetical protein